MYREAPARPKVPPTRIAYRAHELRIGSLLVAVVMSCLGLFLACTLRTTHLHCTRAVCTIDTYAAIGSRSESALVANIRRLDVTEKRGSKGSRYAVAELRLADGVIDISKGAVSAQLDLEHTREVQGRFTTFLARHEESFDGWLRQTLWLMAIELAFAAVTSLYALAVFREQLGQLRRIVVVVDHEQGLVRIGRKEVPLEEIAEIELDEGRALFWSSGKNERIPGYRLSIVTKNGIAAAATADFRAGSASVHENALAHLRRACGIQPHG